MDILDQKFIHCKIKVKSSDCQFLLTIIYASNSLNERLSLWDDLRKLRATTPWITVGDFNNVLKAEEREGGSVPSV